MCLVYMIIRNDDMCYIGATVNLPKRIYYHRKSERFTIGIKEVKVLYESSDYFDCLEKETYFVKLYDTYSNGLNKTNDGKGKSSTTDFTTFNYEYSEESKNKMRVSRKNFFDNNEKRWSNNLSIESRDKLKLKYSNKILGPTKLTDDIKNEINARYAKLPKIPTDYLRSIVKVSQKDLCNILDISELKTKNGRPINYINLFINVFCKDLMDKYNITSTCIHNFIIGKSWNGTVLYK